MAAEVELRAMAVAAAIMAVGLLGGRGRRR
jgi:hypothetical protein